MKAANHLNSESHRWSLIEGLYHSASELPPGERRSYLAASCSGDEALFQDVLSLINSDESEDSFLSEPAFSLGLKTLRQPREELSGTVIDRYQLVRRLGSGGMGDVYLAHDPRLNRQVALKLLNRSILNDDTNLRRFEQEAQAASAISDQNVAHIYELGEAGGRQFITMEYVEGPTLRQVLKEGAVDTERAVKLVAQILSALIAAHRARVIHRDIKPENIIITEGDTVKVLDFGLAKFVESQIADEDSTAASSAALHATSGLLMGTSHYMSPEQVERQPVDVRTDLWSVGVVLYELLCEYRPFTGPNYGEVMEAVLTQPPRSFAGAPRDVPPALQELTLKALSKSSGDRFQTATEMLAALDAIGQPFPRNQARPLAASRRSPLEAALDDAATGGLRRDQATKELSPHERSGASVPRRFPRWPLGVAFALVLALSGTAIYFAFFRQRTHAYRAQFQTLTMQGVFDDLAISPDGKFVARAETIAGKHEVHLADVATSTELPLLPAADLPYRGLTFSPDSNYLYYLEDQFTTGTLFRIPKLGGSPQRLLPNVNTAVSFSPDGQRIAFFRSNEEARRSELIIAQADGTAPRVVASRDKNNPYSFPIDLKGPGPVWSPDGASLACPTLALGVQPQAMRLELVSTDGSRTEQLGQLSWYQIWQLVWLAPDREHAPALVIAATPAFAKPSQLSLISYPDGKAEPLSNDANNYTRLSAATHTRQLLTLAQESNSAVWKGSADSGGSFRTFELDQADVIYGVGDSSSDALVYTATDGVSDHLWLNDPAGSGSRQLSFGTFHDWKPVMTPDGQRVVFVSNRGGKVNLWTMTIAENEPRQLTTGANDDMPAITPDGRWVIYRTSKKVKRVPIAGGDPEDLIDRVCVSPVISPDGRLLAILTLGDGSKPTQLELIDLATRQSIKKIPLPEGTDLDSGLRWSPDGNRVAFVGVTDGIDNIWLQPIDGSPPVQISSFDGGEITSFAWGRGPAKVFYCLRTVWFYAPTLLSLS